MAISVEVREAKGQDIEKKIMMSKKLLAICQMLFRQQLDQLHMLDFVKKKSRGKCTSEI